MDKINEPKYITMLYLQAEFENAIRDFYDLHYDVLSYPQIQFLLQIDKAPFTFTDESFIVLRSIYQNMRKAEHEYSVK